MEFANNFKHDIGSTAVLDNASEEEKPVEEMLGPTHLVKTDDLFK